MDYRELSMWYREARKARIEREIFEVNKTRFSGLSYRTFFYSRNAEYLDLQNEDK